MSKTHGHSWRYGKPDRLFKVWMGMKNRCYKEWHVSYACYGGKGITVCDEWRNNFQAFYDWAMANGYDYDAKRGECTIDRIDNAKGYSPDNCRWTTVAEQNRNKSNIINITFNGETHNIAQWARITGINATTIQDRWYRGYRGELLFVSPNTLRKPEYRSKKISVQANGG